MTFEPVRLPDGLDFLWKPVRERYVWPRELRDGTYDLEALADIHDMMAVSEENIARANEAMKREAKR